MRDIDPTPLVRYFTLPMDVFDAMCTKQATVQQLKFYHLVHAYTHAKGMGCFASNETLARRMGVNERTVQKMVVKGIRDGFLVQVGWRKVKNKSFRIIQTTWESISVRDAQPGTPRDAQPGTQSIKYKNRDSAVVDSTGEEEKKNTKEKEMPILDQYIPTKPAQEDKSACDQLLQALKKAGRYPNSRSDKKWNLDMARLRRRVGTERLTGVLDWYCANITNSKAPRGVRSPEHLAKPKIFEWIEDLMKKDAKGRYERTEAGAWVEERVESLHWPKIKDGDLRQAIEVSIVNFNRWMRRLDKCKEDKLGREGKRLLADLQTNGPTVKPFVLEWFRKVQKDLVNWKDWSGNLLTRAVWESAEAFNEWGRGWARRGGHVGKGWDEIMEEVSREGRE